MACNQGERKLFRGRLPRKCNSTRRRHREFPAPGRTTGASSAWGADSWTHHSIFFLLRTEQLQGFSIAAGSVESDAVNSKSVRHHGWRRRLRRISRRGCAHSVAWPNQRREKNVFGLQRCRPLCAAFTPGQLSKYRPRGSSLRYTHGGLRGGRCPRDRQEWPYWRYSKPRRFGGTRKSNGGFAWRPRAACLHFQGMSPSSLRRIWSRNPGPPLPRALPDLARLTLALSSADSQDSPMRSPKTSRIMLTRSRSISCTTTSAAFTRHCVLRMRWKQGLQITFGASKELWAHWI